jgi:hypothetical protein
MRTATRRTQSAGTGRMPRGHEFRAGRHSRRHERREGVLGRGGVSAAAKFRERTRRSSELLAVRFHEFCKREEDQTLGFSHAARNGTGPRNRMEQRSSRNTGYDAQIENTKATRHSSRLLRLSSRYCVAYDHRLFLRAGLTCIIIPAMR